MPQSHRISLRVHTPLLEWIEQQAVDGESASKVVQRLIVELAANDGVVFGDRIDLIEERVNQRFAELEAVMATFADDLKRFKRDCDQLDAMLGEEFLEEIEAEDASRILEVLKQYGNDNLIDKWISVKMIATEARKGKERRKIKQL